MTRAVSQQSPHTTTPGACRISTRESHEARPIRLNAALHVLLYILIGGQAVAQTPPQEFLKPRLVLNGQGHTASLRAMVFSGDEKYLYSAGLDKVVHVWEFRAGRPRLERTIRPPINRRGGWIYAIAIGPSSETPGERLLAVAGYGVSAPAGEILIYRLPGLKNPETGDLAIHLAGDSRAKPIGEPPRPCRRRSRSGIFPRWPLSRLVRQG